MNFDRLIQQFQRIKGISVYEMLIELALIWVIVYLVMRFLRGTRGAGVIKGIALLLVIATLTIQVLGGEEQFERLTFLYNNLVAIVSIGLIVVFQPELRRGLMRLGETRLFRSGGLRKARVIEEIIAAVVYLSHNKIGALVAFERQLGLRGIIESGTRIEGAVSKELLSTIFWPGSALHDMGVVIRGDQVVAAGVQFPLADADNIDTELGSRHRAAMGLSQETDAMVVVVSEETGIISVAERGELTRRMTIEDLRSKLSQGLDKTQLEQNDDGEATGNADS